MRDVYIFGAGMTKFGLYNGIKMPEKSSHELGKEACLKAIDYACIDHRSIESAFCGTVASIPTCAQMVLALCGISGIPTYNHENGCASSSSALKHAYDSISSGLYDSAIVFGVECWSHVMKANGAALAGMASPPPGNNLNQDVAGAFGPAMLAMVGRAHMDKYGTTVEQFAKVAVKNKKNAAMNPNAQFQKTVTLEEVLNSPMICEPLTKLQCCPNSDGAAAMVIGTRRFAKRYTSNPVKIEAITQMSSPYKGMKGDLSGFKCFVDASTRAYNLCGIGPQDLDVVEVHDDFTTLEVVAYEDLGLCNRGEGGEFIDKGLSDFGGKVVVSPSGGLLGKGHPMGATGVAQVLELFWQLKGECGKRQVENAMVGLAHNGGGIGEGFEPGATTITIISR